MNTIVATVLLAFALILGLVLAMAIGVLNGREPISGSCGGLNNGKCRFCQREGRCRKEQTT